MLRAGASVARRRVAIVSRRDSRCTFSEQFLLFVLILTGPPFVPTKTNTVFPGYAPLCNMSPCPPPPHVRHNEPQADMISLDQFVDMQSARQRLGLQVPVSGNVDPLVLLGPTAGIREAVRSCVRDAGAHGHILNLGHGVLQQTPEGAVAALVDAAKEARYESVLDREGAVTAGVRA